MFLDYLSDSRGSTVGKGEFSSVLLGQTRNRLTDPEATCTHLPSELRRRERIEIRGHFHGSIYTTNFIHKGLLTRNSGIPRGRSRTPLTRTLRTRSERTDGPSSRPVGFPPIVRPPAELPCRPVTTPWIQRVANRGRQRRVKAPGKRAGNLDGVSAPFSHPSLAHACQPRAVGGILN